MKKKSMRIVRLGVLALGLNGMAQAALIVRGNGLIYDDVLDITWLQDVDYARTSGYDGDGKMDWDDAMAWAAGLEYGGYDDWRLPTIVDTGRPGCNRSHSGTDCGWNVKTGSAATTVYSELASLWYDTLGNVSYWDTQGNGPQSGSGTINTGPFKHMIPLSAYWSGTEYAPNTDVAWTFNYYGYQDAGLKRNECSAWAVRDGDVASTGLSPPLIDRGNGLIYDVALDITWLQDANYAKTSGFDADGRMNWDDAMAWAAGLEYGGYDDWRLPTVLDTGTPGCNKSLSGTDCGYNVQTGSAATTVYSELASLWYDTLGNLALVDANDNFQMGCCLALTWPFNNMQHDLYWSGTEYAPDTDHAWMFFNEFGEQSYGTKVHESYAWAVRDGDIASAVPEPSKALLFGVGLAGLLGVGRWQRRCC